MVESISPLWQLPVKGFLFMLDLIRSNMKYISSWNISYV